MIVDMCRNIDNMVVLVCLVTVGQTMSFNCTTIKVSGAAHHTAYNGIYVKTGDQCRDGDTYRQRSNRRVESDGLLVQRSHTDGWVVVANPQTESCPNTTDNNIRIIGRDEMDIPFLVLSVWSEFVDHKVTLNSKLIVECDDIFNLVTCTNTSISSMLLCLWGSKIKIKEAYYFTDGTPGKQTCNADNVVCSSTFTQDELKSLRFYCDGRISCLPWVVPSVLHRNCERNSSIQCDEIADNMDGFVMKFQCRRNRGCKNLRLVNTTYHSNLPNIYNRDDDVICNKRNVYINRHDRSYYMWYSTRSGVTEGWYFGQQISSSGFQCDGSVGTVATADHAQYPEDAIIWYENANGKGFQQTAARVVCGERTLRKLPDPCSPPTTAAASTTTVVNVQTKTSIQVITVPGSITDEDMAITSNDATHTSQQMETDSSKVLSMYTTTIYNDNSEIAEPKDETSMAIIAGAAAGGGGVVIIVAVIVAVLLIRRRKNKANPEMANHDQEMVKSGTQDIGLEPGYAEVSPTGIVLESKITETKLQSKFKLKGKRVKESFNKEQDSRTDKKTKKEKSMEDHVPNDLVKNEQTGAESPNDLYAVVNKPKKNVTDIFRGDHDDVVIENTLYGQADEDDVIEKSNFMKNRTSDVEDNDIHVNDSGVHLYADDLEMDIEPCYAEVRNQSTVINTEHVLSTAEKDKSKSKFKNLFKKAEKQVAGKHKNDAKLNDSDTEVGPQGDVYAVVQKPVKQVRTKPPVDEDDVMVENTMYGAVEENVTPQAPKKHKGSKRNIVTMYADDGHTSNDDDQEVDGS